MFVNTVEPEQALWLLYHENKLIIHTPCLISMSWSKLPSGVFMWPASPPRSC
jgi:hypothetical protein